MHVATITFFLAYACCNKHMLLVYACMLQQSHVHHFNHNHKEKSILAAALILIPLCSINPVTDMLRAVQVIAIINMYL